LGDFLTGLQDLQEGQDGERFLDRIYRIEAKRRKTAAGSPKGERCESIKKILSLGKLL
jgi:hypothetical protein